jgi:hypothetical protein
VSIVRIDACTTLVLVLVRTRRLQRTGVQDFSLVFGHIYV